MIAFARKFVDVIHTDGGFYGFYGHTGTASFYPNGGSRFQPGCSKGQIAANLWNII
jgi:hypothetical protein